MTKVTKDLEEEMRVLLKLRKRKKKMREDAEEGMTAQTMMMNQEIEETVQTNKMEENIEDPKVLKITEEKKEIMIEAEIDTDLVREDLLTEGRNLLKGEEVEIEVLQRGDQEKDLLQKEDKEIEVHRKEDLETEVLQIEDKEEILEEGDQDKMMRGEEEAGVETGEDRGSSQRKMRAGRLLPHLPGELPAQTLKILTDMRDLPAGTHHHHQSPSERDPDPGLV